MANIYVRSTDGSDSDSGATWALAKATAAGASAIDADGDTIYFSQSHSETTNAAVNITWAGSLASPLRLICGDDAAEPPTAEGSQFTIATGAPGSAYHLNMFGNFLLRGARLRAGVGNTNGANIQLGNTGPYSIRVERSVIDLASSNSASYLMLGVSASGASSTVFSDVTVKFSHASQGIRTNHGRFKWVGGGLDATGAATSALITILGASGSAQGVVELESLDLSAMSTSGVIVANNYAGASNFVTLRKCKLPAGWTGDTTAAGVTAQGLRIEMRDCMIGTNKLRLRADDYYSDIRDESVIVRTGGANDGAAYSIKMASRANTGRLGQCVGDPISVFVASSGSKTFSLDVCHDSQGGGTGGALTNSEFGVTIQYPGGYTETIRADMLAAPTDIASSSETWTTTGLTTPVSQRASATVTLASAGEVVITPVLIAPNKTVYVCPKITVA